MKSPSMEPAAVVAVAVHDESLVRVRTIALAYNSVRGPRRVVGAGLASPGRRRVLVTSLQEPLEPLSPPQEGDVALVPVADEEVHGDVVTSDEISSPPDVMDELKIQYELHEKLEDTAPQNGNVGTYADDNHAERADDDSILSEDGVPVENGWKALQQLLMSLGFKMDAT